MDRTDLAAKADQRIATGKLREGMRLLEKAIKSARADGDVAEESRLLTKLGLAQKLTGETQHGITTLQRVVENLRNGEPSIDLAEALNNLGYVERDAGSLDTALAHHQEALKLARELGDAAQEAQSLAELGYIYKDRGKLSEALANFDQALTLITGQDLPRIRANALFGQGLVWEKRHDVAQANNCYTLALDGYRQTGDGENEAATLHNLGKLADGEGNLPDALSYYRQSLKINRRLKAQWGISEDMGAIASIYQAIGQRARARRMHLKNLEFQEAIGNKRGQIWTLSDLAILARDAGEFSEADDRLTSALTLAREMADLHEIYDAHFNRGDIHFLIGQLHFEDEGVRIAQVRLAIEDYLGAVQAAELLRNLLVTENEALGYFDQPRLEAYNRLVQLYALGLDEPGDALVWAERARAREFLRRLGLISLLRNRQLPEALESREADLLVRLQAVSERLAAESGRGGGVALAEYAEVEKALEMVWAEIGEYDPEYVALRRGEPATPAELRACLS